MNKKTAAGKPAVFFAKTPSQRAKPVKRVLWTMKRTGFGAAVKIFKAYAEEYFGHRKSIGVTEGDG